MSRSKAELSLTERTLLQFIKFRTKSAKHPTFFGNNQYIAQALGITPNTAKQLVNKLVRMGYLNKSYDAQKHRHLTYSGKPYTEVIADMRDIDKRILLQDRDNMQRDAEYYKQQYELAQICIDTLQNELKTYRIKLDQSIHRLQKLEQIFLSTGCSKEQLEEIVG